ncbi:MAG: hypothetical protein Q7S16_05220 [bacterium]|nr:hypothetical protein [bacterium]
MTQQATTDPAVTGEERPLDSFDDDPALQGRWVIYEVVSYIEGSGIPDRVIVRMILPCSKRKMYAEYKVIESTVPGRAIGHVLVPVPVGPSSKKCIRML